MQFYLSCICHALEIRNKVLLDYLAITNPINTGLSFFTHLVYIYVYNKNRPFYTQGVPKALTMRLI